MGYPGEGNIKLVVSIWVIQGKGTSNWLCVHGLSFGREIPILDLIKILQRGLNV